MIDAKRLKEVLERNFGHTGGADVLKQLIDAQPTIESVKQEWISVKDGLPETRGEYLVAYHICYGDNVDKEVLVGMDSFRGKSSWAKNKNHRVIAWMPLPELPKGE